MSSPPHAVRIVIADDHVLFCEGLRRLLDGEPDFRVVATCGDGADAIRQVLELRPDVLLLDLLMPHTSGLDALRGITGRGIDVRTIVLTADIDSDDMLRAIQLGARGVLLKDSAPQVLFKCVRTVMQGDYWVGRQQFAGIARRLHHLEQQEKTPPAATLSDRELEIVAAVLDGASNKDIGAQHAISVQTVKNHLSHIFDKLGVSSRLELALYAGHHRLLDQRGRRPD